MCVFPILPIVTAIDHNSSATETYQSKKIGLQQHKLITADCHESVLISVPSFSTTHCPLPPIVFVADPDPATGKMVQDLLQGHQCQGNLEMSHREQLRNVILTTFLGARWASCV